MPLLCVADDPVRYAIFLLENLRWHVYTWDSYEQIKLVYLHLYPRLGAIFLLKKPALSDLFVESNLLLNLPQMCLLLSKKKQTNKKLILYIHSYDISQLAA